MAERDIMTMKQKELKQLHVIHKVLDGAMTQRQAAEVVSLSERQIRRIVKRIRAEGDKGIQHRSRGKASNRRLPKKLVARVVQLYQEKYQGFGPTLMVEKLFELEGIEVSKETVRGWLIEAGQGSRGVRAGRTGNGGSERVVSGRCCSSMAAITTGLKAGGRSMCLWPT